MTSRRAGSPGWETADLILKPHPRHPFSLTESCRFSFWLQLMRAAVTVVHAEVPVRRFHQSLQNAAGGYFRSSLTTAVVKTSFYEAPVRRVCQVFDE